MILRLAVLGLLLLVAPLEALEISLNSSKHGAALSLESGGLSEGIQIFLMMTAVAVLPAILILCTSFTRILIVLAMLRQALGLMQVPPTPVLVGLSMFLTFFTMAPVISDMEETAFRPMMQGKVKMSQGLKAAEKPLRDFLFSQVREADLEMFVSLSGRAEPAGPEEVPTWVLVPAFAVSELKTAFKIGFLIYVPFLVLDLMIASVLMSMGLMMLPPTIFAVPLKLLLFTVVDGWSLVVMNLVRSFGG